MELEELVESFNYYFKKNAEYENGLENAIESGNREFGSSYISYENGKAFKQFEGKLNAYIDQRIGLFFNKYADLQRELREANKKIEELHHEIYGED